ncbi:unnamed protein product [Staurois parvus]|uniref:Uncharacterized protein n=1 Tax=Staurois parvus TaxID=386267 RepID=A0ABN9HMR2_9NEOB|nr:unnamed protein product [Staurois parvus]
MALGRKGLTCGVIKWLTVCCFTLVLLGGGGCVLHRTPLIGREKLFCPDQLVLQLSGN